MKAEKSQKSEIKTQTKRKDLIESVKRLVKDGYSNDVIAKVLNINPRSVGAYKAHITMGKTAATTVKPVTKAGKPKKSVKVTDFIGAPINKKNPIIEKLPFGELRIDNPTNVKIFLDKNAVTITW